MMNNMNSGQDENCFQITYGLSVGRFKLGTHINDMLEVFSNEYPRLQLEVTFADGKAANASDVQINVPQWGLRFRFQPLSQLLYIIDIHNFNVPIAYNINGFTIRGQEKPATFSQLQKALGPTFPGKFIDEGQYLLNFDGVGLLFYVPLEFQSLYADGTKLPIVLPDKSSAVLQRVYIHNREFDMEHPELYPDEVSMNVSILLQERCEEKKSFELGSHFHLFESPLRSPKSSLQSNTNIDNGEHESCIALGMTPQDIVSTLGTPEFASLSPQSAETFIHKYEYRKLGIEIYFSKNTHAVFRIVAHTNLIQHQDFGHFRRCGFTMKPSHPHKCPLSQNQNDDNPTLPNSIDDSLNGTSCTEICTSTPWTLAQSHLRNWFPSVLGTDHNESQQMCQDTSVGAAAIKPVPAGCPFPPTQLHAYPALGVMFEVAACGLLSSITLLDPRFVEA